MLPRMTDASHQGESDVLDRRACGVLMHPTSLPGAYGIGSIGRPARRFIRALRDMGQRYWQILPMGPTGYGDSPYQSFSTFAGNPLWIDLHELRQAGLLTRDELGRHPRLPADRVDFGRLIEPRLRLLRAVADAFHRRADTGRKTDYEHFRAETADWLDDYALFTALKHQFSGRPWQEWPRDLARRKPAALREARRSLRPHIEAQRRIQFLFHWQWRDLRTRAREAGIRIIGDIPIFVAQDSADVWARPDLFQLDPDGCPLVVAGVPPDYFSPTGQRWGNPVYDWPRHAADGFAWWIDRFRHTLKQVDMARLDHFRGFAQTWEIPAEAPTAEKGRWADVPGGKLLEATRNALGTLPLIAEDLGHITPDVHALRDRFKLPGMRVLPFTLHELLPNPEKLLEEGPENEVFYSGTHDNEPLCGWLSDVISPVRRPGGPENDRRKLLALLPRGKRGHVYRKLVELVLSARSRLTLFPMQDLIGLDSASRMNHPGTAQGNWQWRMKKQQLGSDLIRWMASATSKAGR